MLSRLKRFTTREKTRTLAKRRSRLLRSVEQLESRQLLAADIDFSTFFPSTTLEDGVAAVAQDAQGNAYVADYRYDSSTFEIEAAVNKLSPTGDLLWSQEVPEYAYDLAVGDDGLVYLITLTSQDGLPVTSDAPQPARAGGIDLYAMILDGNAIDSDPTNLSSNELVFASYLGGSADEGLNVLSIAIGPEGGLILGGATASIDFPTTGQVSVDSTFGGGAYDGVVASFQPKNDGSYQLQLSTYLGDSGTDRVNGIGVDASGTIHAVGNTTSANFPLTSNAIQSEFPTPNNNSVGFVTRLSSDGVVQYSTFLGGDGISDIAVDETGNSYVVGAGGREGFPVTPGAYAPSEVFGEDGVYRLRGTFVSKIDATGELEHSSWFQPSQGRFSASGAQINLDDDRPVISGYDSGGPTKSSFFLRFNADLSGIVDRETVDTIDVMPFTASSNIVNGSVYVAGFTNNSAFETTPDAIFPTKDEGADGFVRKYSFGDLIPPTITPQSFTLDESISAGSAFAIAQGLPSSSEHTLDYSIIDGNIDDAFAIDTATGKLIVNDPSVLDFTNYSAIELTVAVTDDQSPPQSNSAVLTIQPFKPVTLAVDTFDSRRFDRGEGWIESEWQTTNYTYIVDGYNDDGNNFAGTMLENDEGLLQRSFDSSNFEKVSLSFWTKLKSLESNDRGLVQVSTDGQNWQTVKSFVDGNDDDTWRFQELEISTPGDRTYLRFDAEMSQSGRWWRPNNDYWYIDEINVTGIDQANREPIAQADAYEATQNQPLEIGPEGVLANDVDPDGDAISATVTRGPGHGTLSFNANGSFIYTPHTGFSGADSFDYKLSDGDLSSNDATVSIEVVASNNQSPVANTDDGATSEDQSVTLDVLANDTDPESDTLNILSVTEPVSGAAAIVDGRVQYTPNPNFNGSDRFNYTIIDVAGNTATAAVNVNVAPVNDAPVAMSESYSLDQDNPLSIAAPGVLNNDTDVDGDELTAALVASPSSGSLTLNADGSFSYTPNAGFVGADSFQYRAQDSSGAHSVPVTVSLEVNAFATGPNLSHGVVSGVTSDWQTVSFGETYDSAVVVATPQYIGNSGPGVVRISNVTSTTFDVSVASVGDNPFSGNVHFVAVEEGVYDEPDFKLEAVKYSEAETSRKNGWLIDTTSYQQSYTAPVVVGQVMTANDPNWSVFWASSNSRTSPPTADQLNVGKHIAEDTITSRGAETIGYFVIEATQNGEIEGLPFVAGVGGDTVRGIDNGIYRYDYTAMPRAKTAVLGSAGMDGGDGGWPVLIGPNALPLDTGTIDLAYDEDQLSDSERKHTTEQVAYFVIDPPPTVGAPFEEVPMDLNGDAQVTASDALRLINRLAERAADASMVDLEGYDINRDGKFTALDALMVINELARQSAAEESLSHSSLSQTAVDQIWSIEKEDDVLSSQVTDFEMPNLEMV